MGERNGLGLVEYTILEALDALGARPGRRHRPNAMVLAAVEDRLGLARATPTRCCWTWAGRGRCRSA